MAPGNLRQGPSAGFVTFRLYRSSPPCRPLSPEGSGRRLRVHDLDGFHEPSPTGSDCCPCSHRSKEKNDSLWLAKVTIFDKPSSSATFARGQSPTVAPRGRGPTLTDRTLEEYRSIKTLVRKRLPRRSEVGVNRRCFAYTRRDLIRRRSDFSSILPLGEQCEVTPL